MCLSGYEMADIWCIWTWTCLCRCNNAPVIWVHHRSLLLFSNLPSVCSMSRKQCCTGFPTKPYSYEDTVKATIKALVTVVCTYYQVILTCSFFCTSVLYSEGFFKVVKNHPHDVLNGSICYQTVMYEGENTTVYIL